MYVRIARFEGVDRTRIDDQLNEIRRQIDEGRRRLGGAEMTKVEVEGIKAIERTLVLIDRDAGRTANVVFCRSKEDLERAHLFLDSMSPSRAQGRRTSVEMYEVAIDETLGVPLAEVQST